MNEEEIKQELVTALWTEYQVDEEQAKELVNTNPSIVNSALAKGSDGIYAAAMLLHWKLN